MDQEVMPRTPEELKKFIVDVVSEAKENEMPFVSDEEQKEIEELYGEKLDEEYNPDDYVTLEDVRDKDKKEG
tara:strand:+ start:553 stop:768 length:216 start_codon:yes stop_codon:yes gene_type:complete